MTENDIFVTIPDVSNNMSPEQIELFKANNYIAGVQFKLESEIKPQNTEQTQPTESPVETQLQDQSQSQTENNFDWKIFGEDIKSHEDIKTRLNELNEYKTKAKTLEEQLLALKESNPFVDDENIYKIYMAGKEHPDKKELFQELIFGKPDPLDILVKDYMESHPNNKNVEAITKMIKERYSDFFNGDPDDDEYEIAKMRLQDDAEIAKSRLLKPINEIKVPKSVSKEELEARISQTKESWQKVLSKALEGDIEYPFQIGDEKFHTVKISGLGKSADKIAEFIAKQGLELNEANLKNVFSQVIEAEINQKKVEIMYQYGKEMYERGKRETEAKYNGVPPREPKAGEHAATVDKNMQIWEEYKKIY